MEESRTKKSIRNTFFSFAYKFSDAILAFALRTVFIYTLGISYLGLNGLFANILTVLSLMELGVGGAIIFSLYEPLAQKRYGKVVALMQLYKTTYRIIGILVCIVGVTLTPFLKYIVNLPENVDGIYIIYWLSVANTAVSYFLAYRRSLLIADQRSDINIKNQLVFRITRFLALTIVLLVSHNYILFLVVDVVNTLLSNIQITLLIKKRYHYIEDAKPEKLTKEENSTIRRFVVSGIFFKFGQTIVNCTDNIIISTFIGTILVGIYSNYYLITSNFEILIALLFSGLTASIGNYAVTKSKKDAEKLFKKVLFINYSISYYFTICVLCLVTPFVELWVGAEYILSPQTVAIICLNFYISTMQKGTESFLGAVGEMFYHNRHRSLIEGIVNLCVSLFLVKFTTLGISGVFLGTTVCFLFGRIWMDAFTLYKYWFRVPFKNYVGRYALYFVFTIVMSIMGLVVRDRIMSLMGLTVVSWLTCAVSISLISIGMFWIIFHRSEEFAYLIGMIRKNNHIHG